MATQMSFPWTTIVFNGGHRSFPYTPVHIIKKKTTNPSFSPSVYLTITKLFGKPYRKDIDNAVLHPTPVTHRKANPKFTL